VRTAVADAARGSGRAAAWRAGNRAVENAVAAVVLSALDSEVSDVALGSVRLVTPAVEYLRVVGDEVDLAGVCDDAMCRAARAAAHAAASAPAHRAAIAAAAEHTRSAAWEVVQAAAQPSTDSTGAWRTLWDAAAHAARAAARQAAADALEATTRTLQHQAVELLDELLPPRAARSPTCASRRRGRPSSAGRCGSRRSGAPPDRTPSHPLSFRPARAERERTMTPPISKRSKPC
jgi:hypothetical protein